MNSVRPSSWEVKHLPRMHCERNWRCFRIEWKFFQVWFGEAVQCSAPFQTACPVYVVEILVVCWREYRPAFAADDLVGKVVFAIYVPLSESARSTNPASE